jgi:hypothetical protein
MVRWPGRNAGAARKVRWAAYFDPPFFLELFLLGEQKKKRVKYRNIIRLIIRN